MLKDMTGKVCGRLTVLSRADNDKSGIAYWLCKCSCGKETVVKGTSLRSGRTSSCGCLISERAVECNTRHGFSPSGKRHYLYTARNDIITRCYNEKCSGYHRYGGRGIVLHEPWKESAGVFMTEVLGSIGERPSNKYSLDRIDNDLGYIPGNLRWATAKEQANNRGSSAKEVTC